MKAKRPIPHHSQRVGFFVCAGPELARVVRVELAADVEQPPRTPTVLCPVCGDEHEVLITWRQRTGYDKGREAELVVE